MSLAQRGSGLLDCLIAVTVMSIGSLGMAEMGVHRQQLLLAANQHAETVEAARNTAVLLGSTGGLASEAIAPADGRFNIALHSDNNGWRPDSGSKSAREQPHHFGINARADFEATQPMNLNCCQTRRPPGGGLAGRSAHCNKHRIIFGGRQLKFVRQHPSYRKPGQRATAYTGKRNICTRHY